MPLRYLGVSLHTKKVAIVQYQSLIEQIMVRIDNWTTKFLSYAEWAQLIKSILFSIQVFWSQVFIIPNKVIKDIEKLRRIFVRTGGVYASKKALIAWEHLWKPSTVGGLSLLNVHTWNKAAISKLLWSLGIKKDRLWVRWVHMYYRKQEIIWGLAASQTSWR